MVTTSKANQGIRAVPGEHLLVADNPDDFASGVSRLLKDLTGRIRLGTEARQFIVSNFNWQTNMGKFEDILIS